MRGESLSAWRARQRGIERAVDDGVAAVKAEHDERWEAAKAATNAERANRAPITRETLTGAEFLQDRYGWQKIVRLNPKTVTVAERTGTRTVKYSEVRDYRPRRKESV